jgi:hypothetical protein
LGFTVNNPNIESITFTSLDAEVCSGSHWISVNSLSIDLLSWIRQYINWSRNNQGSSYLI